MSKTIYEIPISKTASAGVWTLNTHNIQAGLLKHILVASALSTTTFDFKLIDPANNVVYDTDRREKTALFTLDDEVDIPVRGIHTLQVYNADSDDTFTGKLMVQELD